MCRYHETKQYSLNSMKDGRLSINSQALDVDPVVLDQKTSDNLRTEFHRLSSRGRFWSEPMFDQHFDYMLDNYVPYQSKNWSYNNAQQCRR